MTPMIGYTLDLGVAQLNLAFVTVALAVNAWAIFAGDPDRRVLRAAMVAICAVYAVSYVILLADFPPRVLAWSRVMRGVALVAWVVVWIVPPMLDIAVHRRREEQARRLEEDVQARLKGSR